MSKPFSCPYCGKQYDEPMFSCCGETGHGVPTPIDTSKRAVDILRTAANTIDNRGKERDQPDGERSMRRAVEAFWTLYGIGILERGMMTETEGWEFMSILKKARKAGGAYREDDYLDDVAYCALSAECEAAAKG